MKVIALSGWKKSGKDTLASHLIEKYSAVRVSFADPLKDSVAEEFDISRTSLDSVTEKETPLLHLPVDPQDDFSKTIAEFMVKEFRTSDGEIADTCTYKDNKFYGVFHKHTEVFTGEPNSIRYMSLLPMYWTPRALAILKGSVNRSVASDFWVKKAVEKIRKSGSDLLVIPDLRYKSEMKQLTRAFGDDVSFVRVNRFDSSESEDPSERDLDDAKFDYYIDNKGTVAEAFKQLEKILSK
jgi:hypothetical protein